MFHAQIAQRAFNTALLVEPAKAMAFMAGLGARITGRRVRFAGADVAPEAVAQAALPGLSGILINDTGARVQRDGQRPFGFRDGIAVVGISGVLVHRGAWIGESSGQTSYEGIAAQLAAALGDPAVRGIALEIDSFGGEVAGAFDLADAIRAARAQKPVWAFVADHAFSAGYALASQADRIILPRTGAVGSIGVVVMHTDMSGELQDAGVTITLIHSGAHKVDGNPFQPLPAAVRSSIQEELDALRTLFAQTVAAGRGSRLTEAAALATEAESYRGAAAVRAGLADEVSDPASAFAAFAAAVNGRPAARSAMSGRAQGSRLIKENAMTTSPQTAAADPLTEDDGADPQAAAPAEPIRTPAEPAAAPVVAPAAAAGDVARIRAEAAELATIGAQAVRLGLNIDVAAALRGGVTPDALRASVLKQLSERSDAEAITVVPAAKTAAPESPIVAAASRAAAATKAP
ncbi:serine peptidase [Defluviimonas sp. 20V17]|uniref:Serine peptidase n=1 Tax=Allgaiera indica TaxID=765699 RepID=A0AAN4UUR6_9RHOB|nr:S49 family peptidase [Allgaiera indica]KDB04975.1 serine peptidase [Defluviimonas sp. 20V17]GHE05444.1 serine peptidase [Allgaiera indica]SDX72044.1 protein C Serine peptidase. MEROPS family S49 [Allgaiera indica]